MVAESSAFRTETETGTISHRGAGPFLPALVIPAADAVMLLVAVTLFGRGSGLGTAYGVMVFLTLAATGTLRPRLNPTLGHDLPALLGRLAVPLLLLSGLALPLGVSSASLQDLVRVAAVATVLVPVERCVTYAAIRLVRARGYLLERALIVGAGEVGAQVQRVIQEHREYGLVPVGFVDSSEGSALAMPILCDVHAFASTVKRAQVTTVIIAFGAMGDEELAGILRACDALPVELYVVPRFFERGGTPAGLSTEDVWGIPLVWLRRPALRRTTRLTKRAFDLVLATVGLLLAAPVFLAVAVAVRRSSPGPVFFRQLRIGRDGRPFELLKFRTMQVNSDSDTTWSVVGDTRITRTGMFLRCTFLDELPQLLNVLRGDMSLVGPRPERPYFAERFAQEVPRYGDRHRMPGGITGWAQVHGLKGDTPILDRARFDNHYIEHWSLWRDVVIAAHTCANILLRR